MIRRPPRSTLFPNPTPSDPEGAAQRLDPADDARPAAERHHGDVVLAADGQDRPDRLGRARVDDGVGRLPRVARALADRKSTRLNSSHANISYAVFCLKKKNN